MRVATAQSIVCVVLAWLVEDRRRWPRMRFPKWSTLACLYVGAGQASFGADVTIGKIIETIRTNEALYKNCDVVLDGEYTLLREPRKHSVGYEVTEHKSTTRYVLQEGMCRMEVEAVFRDTRSEDYQKFKRLRIYDGTTSRALEGSVANIVDGPVVDEHIIPPHMLVMQKISYPVPLSTYLQGEEALAAYPGNLWSARSRRIEVEYLGEEERDGHPCQKLTSRHITKSSGDVQLSYVLWLASDRNYIPIRVLVYSHQFSEDLPYTEGVVESFKEVAPGVWFPSAAKITVYDNRVLGQEKRQVPAWEQRYTVKEISLHPSFPVEFFRDLEIPDGTTVYHVDVAGNTSKSFVKEAPDAIPELQEPQRH